MALVALIEQPVEFVLMQFLLELHPCLDGQHLLGVVLKFIVAGDWGLPRYFSP
jgi:hypothetical protein